MSLVLNGSLFPKNLNDRYKITCTDLFRNSQQKHRVLFGNLLINLDKIIPPIYDSYFSGYSLPKTELIFVENRSEWEDIFARYPFSEWGAGIAIPSKTTIFILIENFSLAEIKKTIIHEWLHIAVSIKFGEMELPRWFEEGLVQKMSGQQLSIADMTFMSNMILTDQLLSFKKIDSIYTFTGNRARLAYHQSLIAVNQLSTLTGISMLDKILLKNKPLGEKSFEVYFQKYAKISIAAFESRCQMYIRKKYRWFFIFNLENTAFLILIIVLAGAYYHIRYRNRKILESWEMDENSSEKNT